MPPNALKSMNLLTSLTLIFKAEEKPVYIKLYSSQKPGSLTLFTLTSKPIILN